MPGGGKLSLLQDLAVYENFSLNYTTSNILMGSMASKKHETLLHSKQDKKRHKYTPTLLYGNTLIFKMQSKASAYVTNGCRMVTCRYLYCQLHGRARTYQEEYYQLHSN